MLDPDALSPADLAAIMDALPLGIVVQDATGVIRAANPAAARILGLSPEQLLGRTSLDPCWRALREDGTDFPGEEHPAMVALRDGRPVRDSVMGIFNPADETYTWIAINAFPRFEPGAARPFQVLAFFEDITARRLAEQARRESEALYALAFHANPAALSITRAADGVFVDFNGAYGDLFGLPPEARGQSTLEVGLYHDPSQRQEILHRLQEQGRLRDYEVTVRDRAGELHPVLLSAAPITVGGVPCLLSKLTDVTERRRLEAERRQWADAFTHCAHGIALGSSATGQIITCNPAFARLQGRSVAEIAGTPILSAYAPEDHALVRAAIAEADRTGSVRYEARMVRADGAVYPVQMDVVSVRDAAGQTLYRVATQQDITERRRVEQALAEERNLLARRVAERTADLSRANAELEAAARLKDEFLSNMSHELRTPLNAVLSLSESLQEGIYGPLAAPQAQAVRTIAESGAHLLELINDILDLSKLEAGQLTLRTEPVDVHAVSEAALRLVQQAAAQKRLGLALKIDGSAQVVAVDERRLKQILLNLLSNAVKFTPAGGQVGLDVAAEAGSEAVRFTVWDTGLGIPADQLGRLFRPFSQIDNRLSREHAGTGLGLALVRRLTELHGGSVTVESEPGRGSRFTVLLPQPTPPVTPPTLDPAGAERADTLAIPGRALVIEDSPSAAAQLSHYLGELRAEIIVHPRGTEAVERAAASRPDVILLDLILPDQSGWEVLADLRADPRTRAIPVVIISVVDERARGLAAGASAYLVKPITREEFRAALGQALGGQAAAERPVALVIAPTEARVDRSGPVILLAEDNPVNQISLSDFLVAKGYQIELAHNGQEALARAAETRPDLILMDIQMPVMDGLEAIRRLRAQPEFAAVPIIALTALAMPGDRERCLAAGASLYLTKPTRLRELAQTITALLPAQA